MDLKKLKGLSDWPKMRKSIESKTVSVLGKLPKETPDLQVKVMEELEFPGYIRRRINYFCDEWDRVSAWYFLPEESNDNPAVLCLHDRVPQGKDEPSAISGDPHLAFAQHYAELGYVTLAPDCITAGNRISSRKAPYNSEAFYKDNPKKSLLGKMLADHMRCVDVLSEAPEVDPARIGVIGHGLGGTNALLLSAFDERIRACVSSCGFTMLSEDTNPNRWLEDEGMSLLPKLEAAIAKGDYPFDWDQLLAMIAPIPNLLITALNDDVLSNTSSCSSAVMGAKTVYSFLGEADALNEMQHEEGRRMTFEGLRAADEWLDQWL